MCNLDSVLDSMRFLLHGVLVLEIAGVMVHDCFVLVQEGCSQRTGGREFAGYSVPASRQVDSINDSIANQLTS